MPIPTPGLFKHDPSRVHPPGGPEYPEPASRATKAAEPPTPQTKTDYLSMNGVTYATVARGEVGASHRIVWVYTAKPVRNRGDATALLQQVIADFDHDGRDSEVIIRNVEVDCDPQRLITLFTRLGYTLIGEDPPTLFRAAPVGMEPLYAPQVQTNT